MITVNNREINYKIGMSVYDALQESGESINNMTLVVVDEKVIALDKLKDEILNNGMNIKLLHIVSGG
ncbi:thiamine biosynthesis protein ThiS [Sedimentibacter acidaminivorans]|jgi:thiamine biosynthesis protein ThiS|uniref:Thiamine biosynthesis protein ThiS n=1 Tax=Sedimentibacter acidaminivorans TaxID=913099 RepID=A0ABS4GHG8_9FIRM|nr:MoaD/ThiS family protein [Sedimentibacter acidaminivorans]MBP1927148.1 thiamine biosynthesis protein ThiS [Sedimentibacter acidaminivorans]